MKKALAAGIVILALGFAVVAQQPAQQPVPTPAHELYRIIFFKAAPGKLPDLIDAYKNVPVPDNMTPRPMVFRHQSGDDWDLMVLYPMGAKASLDANPPAPPEAIRRFKERVMADYAWHADTYASGPPLDVVQKALAAPPNAAQPGNPGGLYLVEESVALAGHHEALGKFLDRDMGAARARGAVKFEHAQGAPWDFLVIFRYASWNEYAAAETDPAADDEARKQGFADAAAIGLEYRTHISAHHDTFTSRIQ
jgi:hypothetical protein